MQEPEYVVEEAAALVHSNISPTLRDKLSLEDIIEILETEFAFMVEVGIAGEPSAIVDIPIIIPAQLDEDAMHYYIIHQCARNNINLTQEELKEVLDAELLYLEQQGLIDEEGPERFLN